MSVVIRLSKAGRKGERRFRIVVKEKRSRRDGKSIESIGWYEKTVKGDRKEIKMDRFLYWIEKGAKASSTVARIAKS